MRLVGDSDKAMSKMPKIPAEDVLHRRQGDDFCLMRKSFLVAGDVDVDVVNLCHPGPPKSALRTP